MTRAGRWGDSARMAGDRISVLVFGDGEDDAMGLMGDGCVWCQVDSLRFSLYRE